MQKFNKTIKLVKDIYSAYKTSFLRYSFSRRFKTIEEKAEQGEAEAQVVLGVMYAQGIGVSKNNFEAFKWYCKAAERGNTSAQILVGIRYSVGIGVLQNYVEAFRWYCEAAKKNNPKAQIALAFMYANGTGVPQNHIRANEWINLALDKELGENKRTKNLVQRFKYRIQIVHDREITQLRKGEL